MNKIAIDFGGTNTRIACIDTNNEIINVEQFKTDVDDFKLTYFQIKKFIAKYSNIELISFCCPGTIDYENGIILNSNNLPGWRNLKIVEIFKKTYPRILIKIINDAKAAAVGQYIMYKNMPEAKVLFFVTISTGIGAGIVIDGKIYQGYTNAAGEISCAMIEHLDIDKKTLKGIEYYASGTGIKKNYFDNKNIKEIFQSQDIKDIQYLKAIQNRLASFFATTIAFINPGLIVVGGSVAENNQEFLHQVFGLTKELVLSSIRNSFKFKFAKNALEATLLGLVN